MTYDYHAAPSVADALGLLARHGEDAHLMAGGTAVVLMLKQGLIRPGHVVGLRGIAELGGIARTAAGGLRIGALATHREAERSAHVRAYCPALADTFAKVATVRIRNQATVGGNLAHADPAQDPPVTLLALDAVVVARSRRGERRIPLTAFFADYFATALAPDEILIAVEVPPLPAGTRATYRKFLPRTADDYATVSVAAVAADGAARVALGGAGPVPVRATAVEDAVRAGASAADAAALVSAAIDPLDDARGSAAYKREMARVFTERALREVLA